ncbi:MAG: FAD-dependent oxidoreductase [Phycisphaerales bacterium]|jgi:thioredoxin reductase (NADPH)
MAANAPVPTPPSEPATRDDRHAFPRLSDEHLERIERFGTVERLPCGKLLFEQGQRSVDFFVILKGRVEIFHGPPDAAEPEVVHVHKEGGFTGELDLFSDRKILVSGRVMVDDAQCEQPTIIRVPRDRFARLMTAEPDIGNIVLRAFILRRMGLVDHAQGAVTLIGERTTAGMLELERFLRRNAHPVRVLRFDDDDAKGVVDSSASRPIERDDLPVAICPDGSLLRRPSRAELAECLGLTEPPAESHVYDVTVIGAGPAGLAAATYAASEGLSTLVIESEAPGGQAGSSSRIENYLGFPVGLSGQELADRAQVQAQKFGARLTLPRRVTKLNACTRDGGGYELELDQGEPVRTRSVVIASGARWRRLSIDDTERFENNGIHFAATAVEADLCGGEEVVVVGGGNSAGQAAIFLAGHAKCVHMLIRGKSPAKSMSDYLLQRIKSSDRIDLLTEASLTSLTGDGWLESVEWRCGTKSTSRPIRHVFLMIGAVANTDWLRGTVELDENGFVCTGGAVGQSTQGSGAWPLERTPHPLETSLPGVFAAGDVRAGSVKRVASAVGEGSICIQDVHRVLDEQRVTAPAS